jgi:hypothetical protein
MLKKKEAIIYFMKELKILLKILNKIFRFNFMPSPIKQTE